MSPAPEPRELHLADGRVELIDHSRVERSPLSNPDLAPVPLVRRTWTTYNYAALWISMAHCIPTYMLASGLVAAGMNWWQALATILLGNTIVLVPILLNSHPGTKYGIPFPVFARAAYGTVGSNLPALMRALVGCGWFGIQSWIGGEALHTLFAALIPGWTGLLGAGWGGHTGTQWFSFLLFWGLNVLIIYRGMDLLRQVENWAAPFVLAMTGVLLVWAVRAANGFGPLLDEPGKFRTVAEFLPVFVPSLTAMIGYWATLSLNMPDFTRFGRSQHEQMIGQVTALPTTMTAFAAMGVLITSATVLVYHRPIWDPIELVSRFRDPLVVAVSMFTAVVATLAVNIAANVVSPANDFANAFPRLIRFRTGGVITGLIGILMQPWRLLADPSGYIFTWLLGYSGGLGSIAGVLIADYWLVRRRTLALEDLYLPGGAYRYRRGWNWRAVTATAVGCALAWGGLVVPLLRPLYSYAWFVGFLAAALVHWSLMRRHRSGRGVDPAPPAGARLPGRPPLREPAGVTDTPKGDIVMFRDLVTSAEELRAIVGGEPSEVARRKELPALDVHARAFIARSPFLLLGTCSADGRCDVSPKGDAPGFVRVLDDQHLAIPDRPGNKRLDGMRNILGNPHVGLIFLVPGNDFTLRVNGRATITREPELLRSLEAQGKVPLLAIGVEVEEVFLHCARSFRRGRLWDQTTWPGPDALPSMPCILYDQTRGAMSLEALEARQAESLARLY